MGRLFAPKPKVEAPPPAPPPPTPQTMTKDEVGELVRGAVSGVAEQLTQTVSRLGAQVEQLAARQPQVFVQPAPTGQPISDEITDHEIDTAVLSGQGAAARIRAMVDRAVNKAAERVITEHVRPLQDYGVSTIGELSRRITTGGMKHYTRFRKEIDERLNMLTPDVRANPVVIETIYNAVVGTHTDELTREAAEAAVRQAQEGGDPPPAPPQQGRNKSGSVAPGTGAGGGVPRDDTTQIPDLETYLGSGALAGREALQHKGSGGQDGDALARSMGYESWSAYMAQYEALLKAETQGNA